MHMKKSTAVNLRFLSFEHGNILFQHWILLMVFVLTHTHSLSLVKIDLECNDPHVFMYDSM